MSETTEIDSDMLLKQVRETVELFELLKKRPAKISERRALLGNEPMQVARKAHALLLTASECPREEIGCGEGSSSYHRRPDTASAAAAISLQYDQWTATNT